MYGWQGTILRIDLTNKKISKERLPIEFATKYLGGAGLNARLLFDEVKKDTDPMGPDNVLIFGVGPLVGTLAPSGCRMTVTSKSPLSGGFGDTGIGGQFGAELKYAGYDHIIVKGRSEVPVYIWINNDLVELRNAEHLWGKTVWETDDALKEEIGDQRVKTAIIGPASEVGIKFGAIIACRYRAGGKGGGMGTVMASKNLKAVVIRGTKTVKMAKSDEVAKLTNEAKYTWDNSPMTKWFEIHGTLGLTPMYVFRGALPIRAGQTSIMSPERAQEIGTKVFHEKYQTGKKSCFGCFIACTPFHEIKDGPYIGAKGEKPDLPAAICFTSNLDTKGIDFGVYMTDKCNEYGIDIMETGAVLGMAFYWYQQGLITKKDTDGLELNWGNEEAAVKLFHKIIRREGLGKILALGVKRSVDKMGLEYEPPQGSIKGIGNTYPDFRVMKAWGLGASLSPRGADHLKSSAQLEGRPPEIGKLLIGSEKAVNPLTEDDKHLVNAYGEDFTSIVDSLGMCKFWIQIPFTVNQIELIPKLFSAITGVQRMTYDQLRLSGERIWNVMRCFNVRQGMNRKDDTLPANRSTVPKPDGPGAGMTLDLDKMLDSYYKFRGWDNNGIPTSDKLHELGLSDIAEELVINSSELNID